MRYAEHLRLAVIAIAVLVAQLVWYIEFPTFRAVDAYIVFLLLLAAGRGPLYGGIYAILGGAVLDSYSVQYPAFHTLYYLLPVSVGVLFRSRMLLQYRQVTVLALGLMLLFKVLAQFTLAAVSGWVSTPLVLLRINYLPLLLELALIYLMWPRLSELVPERRETGPLA